MTFQSRLTRRTVHTVPDDARNGEYMTVRPGHVNGVPVETGHYVLADVKGTFNQNDVMQDWRDHAPPEDELLGLRSMASVCQGMIGHALSEWLGQHPLSPDLDERARMLPLEVLLSQSIGELQKICQDPRTSLQAQDVLMPVSRVRRTSRRVLTYLAAHPENWMQPTAHGVRPSHLMASVRTETLDIYENRVTAVLLKRLSRHLDVRIRNLHRLRSKFSNLSDFSEVARRGTYVRQQRLYTLWSQAKLNGDDTNDVKNSTQAKNPNKFVEQIERLIAELERLKRKLDRCRNSELYRELQHGRITGSIQITNVFRNETRYRHVALLWHALETAPRLGGNAVESARELQAVASGFTAYTALLVNRALVQLGYAPQADPSWHPGTSVIWATRADQITLTWEVDGVLNLMFRETPLLRIVPLLSKRLPPAVVESPVLAVLFDPDEEIPTRPPLSAKMPDLASVGVSPDDLRSLERVARALAPVTRGRVFSTYPIEVPSLTHQAPDWVRPGNQHWVLDRLPPLQEIETLLERTRAAAGGTTGRVQTKAERRQREIVEQRLVDFEAGVNQLSILHTCPQCRSRGAIFEKRQDSTYAASCTSCHAQWGLRRCSNCTQRHPYLLPKLEVWPTPDDLTAHWADDYFGMDLLSLPETSSHGRHFECPECATGAAS